MPPYFQETPVCYYRRKNNEDIINIVVNLPGNGNNSASISEKNATNLLLDYNIVRLSIWKIFY